MIQKGTGCWQAVDGNGTYQYLDLPLKKACFYPRTNTLNNKLALKIFKKKLINTIRTDSKMIFEETKQFSFAQNFQRYGE